MMIHSFRCTKWRLINGTLVIESVGMILHNTTYLSIVVLELRTGRQRQPIRSIYTAALDVLNRGEVPDVLTNIVDHCMHLPLILSTILATRMAETVEATVE